MVKELQQYSFKINDLSISPEDITRLMGDDNGIPPGVIETIESTFDKYSDIDEVKGGYNLVDATFIKDNFEILIGSESFQVGKSIWHYLKQAEQIAIFTCTAGASISDYSKKLMADGLLIEGYTVDVIGSVVVEKAMDIIQQNLSDEMALQNKKVTNRYSPGYCDWSVIEQHKLFSFLPYAFCGVTINSSALMTPTKSVSGFMGIGENAKFKDYSCKQCTSVNCVYRAIKNR